MNPWHITLKYFFIFSVTVLFALLISSHHIYHICDITVGKMLIFMYLYLLLITYHKVSLSFVMNSFFIILCTCCILLPNLCCVWLEHSFIFCRGAVVLVSMLLHWHKCCHFYCPPVYVWFPKRLLCFRSLYYTIMHFSPSQSCPTHLKLINFIILMSGQEYKL